MKRIYRFPANRCAFVTIFLALGFQPLGTAQATPAAHDSSVELDVLVAEGMERNPAVVTAREHWEALKRVPLQIRTLPDPQIQLQEFTVGSPQPAAGYETSDFYYTGFGVSQDIPGPGKLGVQGQIAEQIASSSN